MNIPIRFRALQEKVQNYINAMCESCQTLKSASFNTAYDKLEEEYQNLERKFAKLENPWLDPKIEPVTNFARSYYFVYKDEKDKMNGHGYATKTHFFDFSTREHILISEVVAYMPIPEFKENV